MRYGARRDERRMSVIFRRSGPRICTNTREHLRMLAHATRTRDQWPADHLSRNTRVLASRGNIDTNPPRRLFPLYLRTFVQVRELFALDRLLWYSLPYFFSTFFRYGNNILYGFRRTDCEDLYTFIYTTR